MSTRYEYRGTQAEVNAARDALNVAAGYPRVGTRGPGCSIDLGAAAAWVANPSGDPPPGVTKAFAAASLDSETSTYFLRMKEPDRALLNPQPSAPTGSTGTVSGTGDGVADDRTGVKDALDDCIAGGNAEVPSGTWRLASSLTREFTADVRVWGAGTFKLDASKVLNIEAKHTQYTQAADMDAGDTAIDVTDATGINVGDVIEIQSNLAGDTQWSQDRREISTVAAVDGDTVTMADAARFDHPAASNNKIRVYTQARLRLDLRGFDTQTTALVLRGWAHVDVRDLTVTGPGYTAGTERVGLALRACASGYIEGLTASGLTHALKVQYSRKIRAYDISTTGVFQPVVVTDWSDDVRVERIDSDETDGGSTDSHPAFNVSYAGVVQSGGEGGFNMRGVGGELVDLDISIDAPTQCRLHTAALSDDTAYDTADLLLDRVLAPNAEVNCGDGRHVRIVDSGFYSLTFGQFHQPESETLRRVTIGSLRVRQFTTTLVECEIDGTDATRDHLLDLEHQQVFTADDCGFYGADYVVKQDTSGVQPRTFTDCNFACDVAFSDTMTDKDFNYTFTRCDFTGVASFPAWMSRPAVTYTDCIGAPV